MRNYYNENDPQAAAWLRELVRQGHIPAGDVDERSIEEVMPDELSAYIQCHFFAGIGGWPYALTLAGWPVDRPVWTGSCPCQPFSNAGKGLGTADDRHLWPVFARLIRACHPPTIFGEQVASKAGREWLAGVFADLEGMGYQRAGADLCAAGVGAPHIRQRLFWVAVASGQRGKTRISGSQPGQEGHAGITNDAGHSSPTPPHSHHLRLGYAEFARLEGHSGDEHNGHKPGWDDTLPARSIAATSGACHWRAFDLLRCTDGKARRVEPGTFPLAHGVPGRVGLLRGYGNAIVPQVAQVFIQAYLDSHD